MRLGALLLAALAALHAPPALAQLHRPRGELEQLDLAAAAESPSSSHPSPTDPRKVPAFLPQELRLRNAALIAGGVLLVGTYGMNKWWGDGFTGSFRTETEHWFGEKTRSGGADKLGHAMFAYAGTRLLTSGFTAVGNDERQARKLGFWSALGVMTAIEVADGYSKQYKFSAEDAVMNVIGTGLGYLAERYPDFDRLIDFRLLYKKSADSSFDPAGDYSGQTYLLAFKATGIPVLRTHEPLRYLELAIGYGTRGFENTSPDRSRNLYVGVSLNVAEVLRQTLFKGRERGYAQSASETFFEYIQLPGTAGLSHHKF